LIAIFFPFMYQWSPSGVHVLLEIHTAFPRSISIKIIQENQFPDCLLLFYFFLKLINLALDWYLIKVLICMSLMTNEYLLICVLAIYLFLLLKYLSNLLPIFKLCYLFLVFFFFLFCGIGV
jgi:hypothetical protein